MKLLILLLLLSFNAYSYEGDDPLWGSVRETETEKEYDINKAWRELDREWEMKKMKRDMECMKAELKGESKSIACYGY